MVPQNCSFFKISSFYFWTTFFLVIYPVNVWASIHQNKTLVIRRKTGWEKTTVMEEEVELEEEPTWIIQLSVFQECCSCSQQAAAMPPNTNTHRYRSHQNVMMITLNENLTWEVWKWNDYLSSFKKCFFLWDLFHVTRISNIKYTPGGLLIFMCFVCVCCANVL